MRRHRRPCGLRRGLLTAEDEHRLGDVRGGPARGGIAALSPDAESDKQELHALYAPPRSGRRRAAFLGVEVTPPRGTIPVWAPIPDGFETAADYCEHVLDEVGVVVSPGGAYGPNGEGFFRISLTTPDDRLSEAMERIRRD